MFGHGVASGEPLPDGVHLWTRAETTEPVRWGGARDAALSDMVASGECAGDPGRDHTVHVDVAGLVAATTYHYRFSAAGRHSTVGRTRTAPAPGTAPGTLRIGVVSCAAMPSGHFNAYARL